MGLSFPVIVKPNYEGSSKGIGDDAVARDARALLEMLPEVLKKYPIGVLVEEFIAGSDVTVPFIEGIGDDGVLLPVDYLFEAGARSRFNLYDYRLEVDRGQPGAGALPAGSSARRDRAGAGHLADRGACHRHARSRSGRLPHRRGRADLSPGDRTLCPRSSAARACSPRPNEKGSTTKRRWAPWSAARPAARD